MRSPHRRDDALETDIEHRRREVDGFIRLVFVCARSLASAEIRKLRMR